MSGMSLDTAKNIASDLMRNKIKTIFCATCLSRDRKLYPIEGLNFDEFCADIPLTEDEDRVCWECKAIAVKMNEFRYKACKAQAILQNMIRRKKCDIFVHSFSELKVVNRSEHIIIGYEVDTDPIQTQDIQVSFDFPKREVEYIEPDNPLSPDRDYEDNMESRETDDIPTPAKKPNTSQNFVSVTSEKVEASPKRCREERRFESDIDDDAEDRRQSTRKRKLSDENGAHFGADEIMRETEAFKLKPIMDKIDRIDNFLKTICGQAYGFGPSVNSSKLPSFPQELGQLGTFDKSLNEEAAELELSNAENEANYVLHHEDLSKYQDIDLVLDQSMDLEDSATCELYRTLHSSNEGKGLMFTFQKSGLLDNAARRRLCNVIITNELKDDADKRISSSRLCQLSQAVTKIFPREKQCVYFTPFSSFGSKQKVPASGKLLDCYRQKRRDFLKNGVIVKEKCAGTSKSTVDTYSMQIEKVKDNEISKEEIDAQILWLQNNCSPWKTVEEYWETTSKERFQRLANSATTFVEYFNDFKALRQPGGIVLLLQDFNKIHPEITANLELEWPLLASKILSLLKAKKTVKGLLIDIKDIDNCSKEVKNLAAFMGLTFLMTTSSLKKNGKSWHPSKIEAQAGFITHLKTSADIEETITKRKQIRLELGEPLQPFVIIVGPTLKEISQYLVVIDGACYTAASITNAVDTCFKAMTVLNSKYPSESAQIWQFIQKAIYKFETKYDKAFTAVTALMTDLEINFI